MHAPHEAAQERALARLRELFVDDAVSLEGFAARVGNLLGASGDAELEQTMSGLPSLVSLTPASHRLDRPLVLRAPNSDLRLGPGWQLAAQTVVCTGPGTARLDLTIASWDSPEVDLRIETWGCIEVLVPEGVRVQLVRRGGRVLVDSLSTPVPGGPVLRVAVPGPGGLVRIRHPLRRRGGALGFGGRRGGFAGWRGGFAGWRGGSAGWKRSRIRGPTG